MSRNADYALRLLRKFPRVSIGNLKDNPGSHATKDKRGKDNNRKRGRTHGRGKSGSGKHGSAPRIGFEGGNTPFYLAIPKEPYYKNHSLRRQYPPLSLLQLQRMIDLGRVNADEPIDLTSICNTGLYWINTRDNHYGINLTDEGADLFTSQINIEVQHASELVIASIERVGGVITTRYFDPICLNALGDPEKFFGKAQPIPRCKLPPQDAVEYYTNANNRGYLADPDKISMARFELSQKYGYTLPDLSGDPKFDMLNKRKDPRQIFFGLEPGWIVNLAEKCIIKPKDEDLKEYYQS